MNNNVQHTPIAKASRKKVRNYSRKWRAAMRHRALLAETQSRRPRPSRSREDDN